MQVAVDILASGGYDRADSTMARATGSQRESLVAC